MKIKILDKISYQTYPITEDMVELDITQDVLNQIGITKCFDVENGYSVIDYNEPQINLLREKREIECFTIINRGALWYETLTDEQRNELRIWYNAWLDVTETLQVPEKPTWIDN